MEKQRPTQNGITSNPNSEIDHLAKRVGAHLKMEETYLQERQEVLEVKNRKLLGERLYALGKSVFEKAKATLPGRKPKS